MTSLCRRGLSAVAVAVLVLLAGCEQRQGGTTAMKPNEGLPSEGAVEAVPVSGLAGAAETELGAQIHNPFDGQPQAVKDGQYLFIHMNCADCHGFTAKGGMGPDLTDKYWRFGGTPVQVYKSIREGRSKGMPAWGKALPPQDIWKIVAYLQSLGGMFPPQDYHAGLQGDLPGVPGARYLPVVNPEARPLQPLPSNGSDRPAGVAGPSANDNPQPAGVAPANPGAQ